MHIRELKQPRRKGRRRRQAQAAQAHYKKSGRDSYSIVQRFTQYLSDLIKIKVSSRYQLRSHGAYSQSITPTEQKRHSGIGRSNMLRPKYGTDYL